VYEYVYVYEYLNYLKDFQDTFLVYFMVQILRKEHKALKHKQFLFSFYGMYEMGVRC
jgi:hypothetical protein